MLASQVAAYYAPVLVLFLLNVYRSFTLQLLFRNVGVLIAWVLVCCAHEELGAQPRRVCKAEVVFWNRQRMFPASGRRPEGGNHGTDCLGFLIKCGRESCSDYSRRGIEEWHVWLVPLRTIGPVLKYPQCPQLGLNRKAEIQAEPPTWGLWAQSLELHCCPPWPTLAGSWHKPQITEVFTQVRCLTLLLGGLVADREKGTPSLYPARSLSPSSTAFPGTVRTSHFGSRAASTCEGALVRDVRVANDDLTCYASHQPHAWFSTYRTMC